MTGFSFTPVGFKLCQRLRAYSLGGGFGFFVNENMKFIILDSTTYTTFKNIVIAIGSSDIPFMKHVFINLLPHVLKHSLTNFSISLSTCPQSLIFYV